MTKPYSITRVHQVPNGLLSQFFVVVLVQPQVLEKRRVADPSTSSHAISFVVKYILMPVENMFFPASRQLLKDGYLIA